MRSKFRPKSFRDLYAFMGEITAYVAGVEVALRECNSANGLDTHKWEGISKRHSIHLGGETPGSLLVSHGRMSILSIYTAFDSYMGSLRKEYTKFFDEKWTQHEGDSPFDAINRNCPEPKLLCTDQIKHQINVIDYYRKVRNVVAHPRDNADQKFKDTCTACRPSIDYIRDKMKMGGAPHELENLTFDDIKLFARLVLDTVDDINYAFTPPDSVIAKKIPLRYQFRKLAHDSTRRSKSICAYLRMEYGLIKAHAEAVTEEFLAH